MAYSGEGNLIEAVVLGDPNKTVIPVVCDSDGRLLIDLSGTTITVGAVQIEDTNGNTLNSVGGSLDVNVTNSITSVSTDAIGSEETVFTTKTALLMPNTNRKGLIIQINTTPISIYLGTTSAPTYIMPVNSVLEIENFTGEVFGMVSSGSTTILVTEKI